MNISRVSVQRILIFCFKAILLYIFLILKKIDTPKKRYASGVRDIFFHLQETYSINLSTEKFKRVEVDLIHLIVLFKI